MSYDGLNSLLQAKDSLAAGTRVFTDSVTFDTATDLPTNYIGSANIRNFSFSQGQGGTLTLGGTANGDGVMVVNNAAGTAVVTLNNSGITVNNGSLSIYNALGSLSFDSSGLVSLTNFTSDNFVSSGTIGGTAILAGGTLNPIVLTRSTKVLLFHTIFGLHDDVSSDFDNTWITTYDGTTVLISTSVTGNYIDSGGTRAILSEFSANIGIVELSAGTHTLITKAESATGSVIFSMEGGYVELGK